MWLYSDFLEIDQRYYPFFSEDADRDDSSYWKSFIPHAAMISLLDGFLHALEGTTKKSLWIHGAYGTGKTHVQFVLKHLLEAPLDEVSEYFQSRRLNEDLFKRLEGLRNLGQGLVVYRSSASSIDSQRRLMVELQVAIKKALEAQGFGDCVTLTLYDQVLARLTGADQVFDWSRAFDKHRDEFADFASAEALVQALTGTGNQEGSLKLMGRVARVLDAEGFFLMDDPATIKEWLKAVISRNHLGWVAFLWDEFTDFFLNVKALSGLQELAHLSTEAPFYLVLTTHRSPELLQQFYGGRQEDWRKLLDRFDLFPCNMEPATAYQLLGNALRPKTGQEDRWSQERKALWDSVRLGAKPFLGESDRLADLQALVPLHPYAAYLLSQIARQFTSSQRTLFRFLRQSEVGSFPVFLAGHPCDGWKWYTADGLWDYFFGAEELELPPGFKEIVSYYGSRQGALDDDYQRRAFKASMLLMGLSREITGVPALQPTLSNLRSIFSGTPLGDKVESVMEALGQADLVRAIRQGTDRQYTIPLGNVDAATIRKYREELTFETEVQARQSGSIGFTAQQLFGEVGDVLKRRLVLTVVAADQLRRRREHVIADTQAFHLGAVIVLCRDDGEVAQMKDLVPRLLPSSGTTTYVLPEVPFGGQRWEEWCEARAHARWYRENHDAQNAQYHEGVATNKIRDWVRLLSLGQMQVFHSLEDKVSPPVANASGQDGYRRILEEIVARRYKWRPELICTTATLYRESYGPKGAEIGLGVGTTLATPYNVLVDQLQKQGLWPKSGESLRTICAARPDHPIAQFQRVVDTAFAERDSVSLNDLWEQLQKPPFGFFPSPLAVTLFGAALRDYVDGYYWRDGVNTRPLDRTKLAGLIDAVMRAKQSVTLTRNTPEAREFCDILRGIFGLSPDESKYPQNVRDGLRKLLTNAGYPLWSLGYASQEPLESLAVLLAPLGDLSNEQVELENQRLANMVPVLRKERDRLSELVQRKPFEVGMRSFIAQHIAPLLDVADHLSLPLSSLMTRLRALMQQETWLWQKEAVAQRLPVLHADLKLTAALNGLLGTQFADLDLTLDSLGKRLLEGKLPLFVLSQGAGASVQHTLTGLERLVAKEALSSEEKLALAVGLEREREAVRSALQDRRETLRSWVSANLATTFTADEAAQVLATLPTLSADLTPTDFRQEIEQRLRDLEKRRLIAQVASAWQEATASESPEEWSEAHGTPLHWLLDGNEYTDLFALLRAPETRSDQDLRAAVALIQASESPIQTINQPGQADKAFLEVALGIYGDLVQTPSDLADLRKRILNAFPQVHQWERVRVNALAKEWLERMYTERIYPQVTQWLEAIPESETRRLLKDLSRDPLVGARLLQRRNS